jgi:hypothetical protein
LFQPDNSFYNLGKRPRLASAVANLEQHFRLEFHTCHKNESTRDKTGHSVNSATSRREEKFAAVAVLAVQFQKPGQK